MPLTQDELNGLLRSRGYLPPEKSNPIVETGKAFASGALNAVQSVANTAEKLNFPGGAAAHETVQDFAQSHQQWNDYPDYNPLNPMDIPRTLGKGAGSMAGQVGVGVAAAAASGGNPYVGGAAMFAANAAQMYGDTVDDMRRSMPANTSPAQIDALATASTGLQSALFSFAGPGAMAGRVTREIAGSAIKDTSRRFGTQVVLDAVKGGGEAGSAMVLADLMNSAVKYGAGAGVEINADDLMKTFAAGAIPGMAIGGAGAAMKRIAAKTPDAGAMPKTDDATTIINPGEDFIPADKPMPENTAMPAAVPDVAPEPAAAPITPYNTKHFSAMDKVDPETVADLRQSITGMGGNADSAQIVQPRSRAARAMADTTKELTGLEPVYFHSDEPINATLTGKDRLYVNADVTAEHPAIATGHEFGHYIERQHPELYDVFRQSVIDHAADNHTEVLDRIGKTYADRGIDLSNVDRQREFANDVLGQRFTDPQFWRDLGDRLESQQPGMGQRMAQAVIRFVEAIKNKVKGLSGADSYIKNLDKVRAAAVDMVAEFKKRQQGPDYESRYRDRVNRLRDVQADKEINAIEQEELNDAQRHVAGTTEVINAVKAARGKFESQQAKKQLRARYEAGDWINWKEADYNEIKAAKAEAGSLNSGDKHNEYRVSEANDRFYIERRKRNKSAETSVKPPASDMFDALTPQGNVKVSGRYRIADADQVMTSDHPAYNQTYQPRNRDTASSQAQIAEMSGNIKPELLGESPLTDTGAPLTDKNGQVISGNGRTMALRKAYEAGKADHYASAVADFARQRGMAIPENVKRPVLVREIAPEHDAELARIAELSNRDNKLQRTVAEQAEADGIELRKSNLLDHFNPGDDGEIMTGGNDDFNRAFVRAVGDKSLLNSAGSFSPALEQRVRYAVLGALLHGELESRQLLTTLVEQRSALGIKRQVDGVMSMTGQVLKLAKDKPEYDIRHDLAQALRDYVAYRKAVMRGEAKTLDDYLAQGSLFDAPASTGAGDFILALLDKSASMKQIREWLGDYVELGQRIDNQTSDMFGAEPQGKEQLLHETAKGIDHGQEADLFQPERTVGTNDEKSADAERKATGGDVVAEHQETVKPADYGSAYIDTLSGVTLLRNSRPEYLQQLKTDVDALPFKLEPLGQTACIAYNAISHDPEIRALQEEKSYAQNVAEFYRRLQTKVPAEHQSEIPAAVEKYAQQYRNKLLTYLGAKAQTMSPMIVGPAKFPTERNLKRIATEQKRFDEAIKWSDREQSNIEVQLEVPQKKSAERSISSDDPNAIDKLQKKLLSLQKMHDFMKEANAIIRRKTGTQDEKVNEIASLDASGKITPDRVRELFVPDNLGRMGFAEFQLTNNNAEIKRIQGRIIQLERRNNNATHEIAFDGGKIVDNAEANRVQIVFSGKPDESIRNDLKSHGFKWAPSSGTWQRMRSNDAMRQAQRITGVKENSYSLRHGHDKKLKEAAEDETIKPHEIINAPDGKNHWGEITPEMVKESKGQIDPGKIVMLKGEHRSEHNGYGAVHTIIGHEKDFARYGYNPDSYIHNVLNNPSEIWYQADRGNYGRYLLVKHGYPKGFSAIELRKIQGEDAYSIVTAFPEYPELRKKINGVRIWSHGAFSASRSQQSTAPLEPLSGKSKLHPPLEKQGPNDTVISDEIKPDDTAHPASAISDQSRSLNRSADSELSHLPLEEAGAQPNAVINKDSVNPENVKDDYSLREKHQVNPGDNPDTRKAHDDIMEDYKPGRSDWETLDQQAKAMIERDGANTLIDRMASGELKADSDLNIRLGQQLMNSKDWIERYRKKDLTAVNAMMNYVESRTEAGRSLAAGRVKEYESPEEFHRNAIKEMLLLPSKKYRDMQHKISEAQREYRESNSAEAKAKLDNLKAAARKQFAESEADTVNTLIKSIRQKYGVDPFGLTPEQASNTKMVASIMRDISAAKATLGDKVYEYWINSVLSGPQTHAANTLGNIANAALDLLPTRFVEALANKFVKNPEAASFGEFQQMNQAFRHNWKDAFKNAVKAFDLELPVTNGHLGTETKFESGDIHAAIGGKWGRALRIPGRFLVAADELAKGIVAPVEASAYAYRMAKAAGLSGDKLAASIKEQLADPRSAAVLHGRNRAIELAFQNKPWPMLERLMQLRESNSPAGWVAKFMLPFIKTPANILTTGIRKSPLGALQFGAELLRNRGKLDTKSIHHLAEQVLAWGTVGALWSMSQPDQDSEPWITGTKPGVFDSGKGAFMARNLPPTSIRIGDTWYSYNRIEPLAEGLAMIVDGISALQMARNGADGKTVSKMLFNSAVQNIRDKTFLNAVGDLIQAAEGGGDIAKFTGNFAGSWIPNAWRQTVNGMDEVVRDNKSHLQPGLDQWLDTFWVNASRGTGFSTPLPKLDLWGNEISKDAGETLVPPMLWRIMSPVRSTPAGMADADTLLWNYNRANPDAAYWPLAPQPTVREHNQTHYINADDYYRYAQQAGRNARIAINNAIAAGQLNPANPSDKDISQIKEIFRQERSRARQQVLGDKYDNQ